ncbi:C40 family peptidase [Paramuribaculum intestinale]|uniref:C40 family peptidase n=1 Tax=Paramuribaculum intestinale TaxID=2094151 RepID=UPI0025B7976E|nr:C40 family peptidase [Paramuribaculum intestinale]
MIRTAVIILLTTIISVPVWARRPAAPVSELMLPIKVETPRTGVFSLIPPIESSLTSSRKIASEGESTLDRLMQAEMVEYAKRYLGCRYRRGSKGPKAFDCSGFTSHVYGKFGFSLGRASRLQGTQGTKISLEDAKVGDLIFFSGRRVSKSTIGHVGMVIDVDPAKGTLKFIHASCSQGVVVTNYPDGGYYSRRFISVRRVIE